MKLYLCKDADGRWYKGMSPTGMLQSAENLADAHFFSEAEFEDILEMRRYGYEIFVTELPEPVPAAIGDSTWMETQPQPQPETSGLNTMQFSHIYPRVGVENKVVSLYISEDLLIQYNNGVLSSLDKKTGKSVQQYFGPTLKELDDFHEQAGGFWGHKHEGVLSAMYTAAVISTVGDNADNMVSLGDNCDVIQNMLFATGRAIRITPISEVFSTSLECTDMGMLRALVILQDQDGFNRLLLFLCEKSVILHYISGKDSEMISRSISFNSFNELTRYGATITSKRYYHTLWSGLWVALCQVMGVQMTPDGFNIVDSEDMSPLSPANLKMEYTIATRPQDIIDLINSIY